MDKATSPIAGTRSHLLMLWDMLDQRERRQAYRVLLLAILAAVGSSAMVASVMPFLAVLADPTIVQTSPRMSWAYRTFGFDSDLSFLVWLGIGSIVVIVASFLLQLLSIYASSRFAVMRIHSISRRLLSRYISNNYEFFLQRNSSVMSSRILSECQEVTNRVLLPTTELFTAGLTILALLVLLMWVNPLITLAAFAVLAITYGGTFVFSRIHLHRLGRLRVNYTTERYRIIGEVFGGIKEIKLLGREYDYVHRYNDPTRRMAKAMISTQIISKVPYFTIQAVSLVGAVALCLALVGSSGGTNSDYLATLLPLLGVFAFAGQRMLPELGRLYQAVARIQSAQATVELIHTDIFENDGPMLAKDPGPRIHLRDQLEFRDVSYKYPGTEQATVSGLSLKIKAGETIGIVGGTGAGKTTLADLILGLLEPSGGAIIVDGIEVTEDKKRQWQKSVGYVPQDIFLGDSSILENIALGTPRENIDVERVHAAAKAAQIDGFIREELPEGYETFVGERGVRLSGGQRQRVGIARALYHHAELIVFDEATSALDNMTESEVMSAIDALPGETTVVMIAHRLTTVERCDRIIVMERGRIVGCDKWENLMKDNPAFRRIAQLAPTS
tara:strand:+ start:887 stop:2731 length:1845 start_codon:yes stop_codon:yes gene_type:complete